MYANLIKNKNKRLVFKNLEITKRINKFLMINLLSQPVKKSNILRYLFLLNSINRKISKSQLKSKCVSTGRNKSVNNKFSLSRIELRKLINTGIIFGYKKAVW